MYYKAVCNNETIDAFTNLVYVRYNPRNMRNMLVSTATGAFGVMSSNSEEIYKVEGLTGPVCGDYRVVELIEVSEREYLELVELLKEKNPDEEPVEPTPDYSKMDLEKAIDTKLAELSAMCNQTIISGFEVTLSDGQEHHFDLTIEDQINLASLTLMINQGTNVIPYHASDELCKFYSIEDIALIVDKGSELKTYHTTYYNSLKNYVKSLTTVAEVEAVKYGDQVPEAYQSEVLVTILGGANE